MWSVAYGHRFVQEETVLLLFSLLVIVAAWQMWRQIVAGDLVAGTTITGMPDYIKAAAERDRNVAF